jgi:hypothetical protein
MRKKSLESFFKVKNHLLDGESEFSHKVVFFLIPEYSTMSLITALNQTHNGPVSMLSGFPHIPVGRGLTIMNILLMKFH